MRGFCFQSTNSIGIDSYFTLATKVKLMWLVHHPFVGQLTATLEVLV
jgi:hypothetical protein